MKTLKKQIEDAEKQIRIYDDKIQEIHKTQRELAIKLQAEKSKEYALHLKEIIPTIEKMLIVLKKYKYPSDSRCSHFGVSAYNEYFTISLSLYGFKDYLCLIIETANNWVLDSQVGLSEKDWGTIYHSLNNKYGVLGRWNGMNKQYSGSYELNIVAPKSLSIGIKNYVAFQHCEFNDLFDKNYKKENDKKRRTR
jgi:hypothetical protein